MSGKVKLYRRLPHHYRRLRDQLRKDGTRVHDISKKGAFVDFYMKDERKQLIDRVVDVPIKPEYPADSNKGLWGGEGVIRGFIQPRRIVRKFDFPISRVWFPNLLQTVVYSEILDKYLNVTVTRRTLSLIDDASGFDNYILRTPVEDLKSQLALDLRREMLIRLAKKDFYKDNPQKFELVWKKYGDCAIPLEEAEWFGLPVGKAIGKQAEMEMKQFVPQPLKVRFTEELLNRLEDLKQKGELPETEKQSVFSRILSSFRKSTDK